MKQISTSDAPGYLPFLTQGMVSNGLLWAAAIPRDPKTLDIPATFEEQVRLSFRNLAAVLDAAGLTLDSLVKVNVYLADMADWAAFNEIYKEYVNLSLPPMRCAVQIAGLNNGYLIELDVIAEVEES
ncbi:RidA family protein [Pseudonocardia xishanensis]|uniref:RidA family protein n=1 Tax=Pseudonocardia xishanensis TaxID=630995 RepID=A0ABP8RZD9_9PSEU